LTFAERRSLVVVVLLAELVATGAAGRPGASDARGQHRSAHPGASAPALATGPASEGAGGNGIDGDGPAWVWVGVGLALVGVAAASVVALVRRSKQ
jgi:hypothetical protein